MVAIWASHKILCLSSQEMKLLQLLTKSKAAVPPICNWQQCTMYQFQQLHIYM